MGIIKNGLLKGLQTTWTLGKIIFPVTFLMTIVSYTSLFDTIINFITPVMTLIGLPGKAAIPLVLGNFLNLYAGIGAILTMQLSVKAVFILAVMLSFSHNLLIESGVAAKVGVKLWIMIAVRVGLALVSALLISTFWHGGTEAASYGLLSTADNDVVSWWLITWEAFKKACLGIFQLACIVIPLMVAIQFLKEMNGLAVFSRWVSPFIKLLGMKPSVSTTMAAGLVFGLAYGAGVMVQAVKEDEVDKKSLYLAFIFLVGCHAVIEDTLIFLPLGISVLPLLLMRLCVAIVLTWLVGWVWKRIRLSHDRKRSASA